jgi:hypothetical protein
MKTEKLSNVNMNPSYRAEVGPKLRNEFIVTCWLPRDLLIGGMMIVRGGCST